MPILIKTARHTVHTLASTAAVLSRWQPSTFAVDAQGAKATSWFRREAAEVWTRW